ncbi:MAG: hypothetical protein JWO95_3234 [Verrucomicrobiales bacterium]|nr:hypothetical protein [Verrucomicrobiales bacterium]
MQPNHKFLRVVLGSVVGASLWAGCATDRRAMNDPAGANYEREVMLDRQANLHNWHSDTHPEWRTGWNMAFPNPPYENYDADQIQIAIDQPSSLPPQSR